MNQNASVSTPPASRRDFLKAGAAAAVAAGTLAGEVALTPAVHAGGSDLLRIGLVGCGNRGTGAAEQALEALASKEDLSPARYEWGPLPAPKVAVPGVTRFV